MALAFVMCGCIPSTPDSIITKVEKSKTQYYKISYKYVITTNNGFCFYTDETFNVGDTIQITKKN